MADYVPSTPYIIPYCDSGAQIQPVVGPSTTVANQETGFPPLQATPLNAGGIPVDIEQFNGILNFYSKQLLDQIAGVQRTFEQDFSDKYNGYPEGIILYCASNNSYQRSLINNNTANFVTTPSYINDGTNWIDNSVSQLIVPTIQIFTSGSGTYTTPTSPRKPLYLRIIMCGGGGGGSGSGVSAGNGVSGTNTVFGTILNANAGTGGQLADAGPGGNFTISSPAIGVGFSGQYGGNSSSFTTSLSANESFDVAGGAGGQNLFSGAGATGGLSLVSGNTNAISNTGCGGSGGAITIPANTSLSTSGTSGAGGGAGGYLNVIIPSPSSSYSYSVGTGGSGGTAGTVSSGTASAGGSGANGIIIIEEYYQ